MLSSLVAGNKQYVRSTGSRDNGTTTMTSQSVLLDVSKMVLLFALSISGLRATVEKPCAQAPQPIAFGPVPDRPLLLRDQKAQHG
jgi:hypothetical protein